MEFKEAAKAFWLNTFNFDGRASRSEYWLGAGSTLAFIVVLSVFSNLISLGLKPYETHSLAFVLAFVGNMVSLFSILPNISAAVRRLHDRNMVGWWAAIGFIPVINLICALIVLTQEGTKGPNRFGPDPLQKPIPDLDPADKASYQLIPPNAKNPPPKIATDTSKPKSTLSEPQSTPTEPDVMRANFNDLVDEDALYEQAFNEMEGGKRVVAAWSRAFAEAAGDEQKAKALYIQSRVVALKQELLDQRAAKEEADQETREEAQRLAREEAEEKKAKLIQRGFVPAEAERLTAVDAPEPTKRRAEALLADAEEKERKALEDKWYKALRELPGCTPESAMRIIAKIHRGEPLTFHEASFWDLVQ
jgi:uncharacterized membrane protein YhaH (DUF805 family)